MIKFRSVLSRYEPSELTQMEAGELLGISERTFRRWCECYDENDGTGLLDRRPGHVLAKLVLAEQASEVTRLYRSLYAASRPGISTNPWCAITASPRATVWAKSHLQSQGSPTRTRRRGAHRRKRPRRPLPCMMLHWDGPRHAWLSGHDAMDLIVTMDDATSKVYSAFLIPEEGTAPKFRALLDLFGRFGLSVSL